MTWEEEQEISGQRQNLWLAGNSCGPRVCANTHTHTQVRGRAESLCRFNVLFRGDSNGVIGWPHGAAFRTISKDTKRGHPWWRGG